MEDWRLGKIDPIALRSHRPVGLAWPCAHYVLAGVATVWWVAQTAYPPHRHHHIGISTLWTPSDSYTITPIAPSDETQRFWTRPQNRSPRPAYAQNISLYNLLQGSSLISHFQHSQVQKPPRRQSRKHRRKPDEELGSRSFIQDRSERLAHDWPWQLYLRYERRRVSVRLFPSQSFTHV